MLKRAPADRCARCAQQVIDLMLEQRQPVLDGIQARLASLGFEAENIYQDWLFALQRIVELSRLTNGDCFWSAPLQLGDKYKTEADAKRLMEALDRARLDLPKTGNT